MPQDAASYRAPDAKSNKMLRLRFSPLAYLLIASALLLTVLPYREALSKFIDIWNLQPEYSHGVLIPFLSLYLVWRQRAELRSMPFTGSWYGLAVIAIGLSMWLVGDLATIYWIVQYGFLVALYGVVLALTGPKVFRRLWMPLLILIFMVPLPAFFNNSLSLQMQLWSSWLGVAIIRLAGISVFLEGNVIDLGPMQLQVAEACDGLRYLFPLMTLAFVMAHLFRAPLWKRVLLFASSVPIAIFMNSLRIGAIGITVEYWGPQMAEGLLHDFEGWVVFMFSTAALVGVAALLARTNVPRLSVRDSFDPPDAPVKTSGPDRQALPAPFIGAAALVLLAALAHFMLPSRSELTPRRELLVDFPTHLGGWNGQRDSLDRVYQDALQLDDYLFANYRDDNGPPVNLYVAWYNSQRSGQSVHSPRACIPGGGWIIRSFEERKLAAGSAGELPINRVLIELAGNKQIVYYWFQQRGRHLTDEYQVKWYIFWDALTRSRTDGALVRLSIPLVNGVDEAAADQMLADFAAESVPRLARYVPD